MKNIHCKVFGHDFRVSRDVTHHVKEYACKNCKKELTINGNGHLTELTPEFKEINDVLERIHMKRHMRTFESPYSITTTDSNELEPIHVEHEVSSNEDEQPVFIDPANLLVFRH